MELLQLRYFINAAESENFSHTAKHFLIPPSAVSQSVRRLEEELGAKLFIRSANRIRLSPEGRIFYESVKDALASLETARRRILEMSDNVIGEMRLFIGTNRRTVIDCIEKYRRVYPDVSFQLNHGVLDDPSAYDLIISEDRELLCGMERHKLVRERIALAMSGDLAISEGSVSLSDFRSCGFIAMHKDASLSRLTYTLCRECGFEPNIVVQSDDPAYIRKYLEMGLGVALIPTFSWKGLLPSNIRLVDVGEYYRDTYVFLHNSRYVPSCVRYFVDMLMEEFKE